MSQTYWKSSQTNTHKRSYHFVGRVCLAIFQAKLEFYYFIVDILFFCLLFDWLSSFWFFFSSNFITLFCIFAPFYFRLQTCRQRKWSNFVNLNENYLFFVGFVICQDVYRITTAYVNEIQTFSSFFRSTLLSSYIFHWLKWPVIRKKFLLDWKQETNSIRWK